MCLCICALCLFNQKSKSPVPVKCIVKTKWLTERFIVYSCSFIYILYEEKVVALSNRLQKMPETSREFVVVLPDENQFTVPVQVCSILSLYLFAIVQAKGLSIQSMLLLCSQ